ncbi:putative transposase [Nostoc sp. NIES-3756]|nr:putative transposase [Nostoc sp. NIES-3756]
MFQIFKPKNRLKEGDKYKSKPQIAIEIIQELAEWGFKIKLVLADSLDGEQRVGRLCRLEAIANPEGESGDVIRAFRLLIFNFMPKLNQHLVQNYLHQ